MLLFLINNAVDSDCVNGPGPPPTVQICCYLQYFGVSGVPELKRYARRVPRTQAMRSLFFEIAESSTLSESRKSNFLRVLHFFCFFGSARVGFGMRWISIGESAPNRPRPSRFTTIYNTFAFRVSRNSSETLAGCPKLKR